MSYRVHFRLNAEPFESPVEGRLASEPELSKFIFSGLKAVGGPQRELFRESAVSEVFAFTDGDVQRVGALCREALRKAAEEGALVVGARIVLDAAEYLGWSRPELDEVPVVINRRLSMRRMLTQSRLAAVVAGVASVALVTVLLVGMVRSVQPEATTTIGAVEDTGTLGGGIGLR